MESTSLLEKVKGISIMLSVDKYNNILDDKKEAVVATSLLEKKVLATEKVTTSE